MSASTAVKAHVAILRQLTGWWQGWRHYRTAVAELDCCGPDGQESIAHDLGVSAPELHILAGKWPDSADLLNRRMEQLGLDATEMKRVEPQVIRDLQRVCTLCVIKRRCAHDLAGNPTDPVWQDYCANRMTLAALIAERTSNGKRTNQ